MVFGVVLDIFEFVEMLYVDLLIKFDVYFVEYLYFMGGWLCIGDFGMMVLFYGYLGCDFVLFLLMYVYVVCLFCWVECMNCFEFDIGEFDD